MCIRDRFITNFWQVDRPSGVDDRVTAEEAARVKGYDGHIVCLLYTSRRERRVEFAWENLRYFDLLRWHQFENAFGHNMLSLIHIYPKTLAVKGIVIGSIILMIAMILAYVIYRIIYLSLIHILFRVHAATSSDRMKNDISSYR